MEDKKEQLKSVFNNQLEDVRKNNSEFNFGTLIGIRSAYYMLFGIDDIYKYMNECVDSLFE